MVNSFLPLIKKMITKVKYCFAPDKKTVTRMKRCFAPDKKFNYHGKGIFTPDKKGTVCFVMC